MRDLTLPRTGPEQLRYWLARDPAPKEFVYIVKAKDDSPIKVGKAENVTTRLAQLQTGNPRDLRLLFVLVGYTDLEWQLHRKLRGNRLRGEWFDGEPIRAFLTFVEDLAEQMLLHAETTGQNPNWRNFGHWENRGESRVAAPVKTMFVTPQPASTEEVLKRLYDNEKARGYAISRPEEPGWVFCCPDCGEGMRIEMAADTWAGTLLCRDGHCWLFTESRGRGRGVEHFVTGPA